MKLLTNPDIINCSIIKTINNYIIHDDTQFISSVEFRIVIDDKNLSVRDFSAFFKLLDNVYGRMHRAGLNSYTKLVDDHLKIKTIKKGSIEAIIEVGLAELEVHKIIILYIAIKYLPVYMRAVSGTVSDYMGAYRDYEETKLLKIQRKNLERNMQDDSLLKTLPKKERLKLIKVIELLLSKDDKLISRAQRFIHKYVKLIELKINNNNP